MYPRRTVFYTLGVPLAICACALLSVVGVVRAAPARQHFFEEFQTSREQFSNFVYRFKKQKNLLHLVAELLDMAALDMGEITLKTNDVDLCELVNVVAHLQRPAASAKRQTIVLEMLNLAIVKQIVELHGGNVGAESELGKGSIFIVELRRKN